MGEVSARADAIAPSLRESPSQSLVDTLHMSAPKTSTATTSPIATLIQRGKSAEGRLRSIHGSSFDPLTTTVSVSGRGDSRKVGGVTIRGKRIQGDALSALSVGDAECWPAYQAALVLAQYLEIRVTDLDIAAAE